MQFFLHFYVGKKLHFYYLINIMSTFSSLLYVLQLSTVAQERLKIEEKLADRTHSWRHSRSCSHCPRCRSRQRAHWQCSQPKETPASNTDYPLDNTYCLLLHLSLLNNLMCNNNIFFHKSITLIKYMKIIKKKIILFCII